MLHTKQASDLLQDLFPTLALWVMLFAKVGNIPCNRSEACFECQLLLAGKLQVLPILCELKLRVSPLCGHLETFEESKFKFSKCQKSICIMLCSLYSDNFTLKTPYK